MLMKLSSWVTTNEKPRVCSYICHSTLHGVNNKNFVVVIFGVWIFGLLQERPEGPARKGSCWIKQQRSGVPKGNLIWAVENHLWPAGACLQAEEKHLRTTGVHLWAAEKHLRTKERYCKSVNLFCIAEQSWCCYWPLCL